jgi:hypothetical protein
VRLIPSPPSVSRMYIKCGNLDVSQPYGSSQPVAGIALPLPICTLQYETDGASALAPTEFFLRGGGNPKICLPIYV